MSSQFLVLLAATAMVPLIICVLAWRMAVHWIWRVTTVATAIAAWLGVLMFVMLHFGSPIAYAAVNAYAPIAAAGLAANVALGGLLGLKALRNAVKGGKD